ncbi:hypothetical protein QJS04_geneDACA010201 [Acorus gramineus]|uniref:Uncharacterized protein n=1 Tax=Acorus gramineus TaxID=55184 RepID=A0AAV9A527_ACOGR|nr:hypothetical protein QJS04_geneDACA010201 [Acorus gramineus]
MLSSSSRVSPLPSSLPSPTTMASSSSPPLNSLKPRTDLFRCSFRRPIVTAKKEGRLRFNLWRSCVALSSLNANVSHMSVNEPEHYRGRKLKVAIIGAGLAGMSTAVELLDQGHESLISVSGGGSIAWYPSIFYYQSA